MSKWKTQKLNNLCTKIGDGLHGTPSYNLDSNVFFINGNNLKSGKIEITENTNRVTVEDYQKNYIPLHENSLLLSINGTLGSMAFYNGEKIILGKSAAYLNFKTGINHFYYYYFQLKSIQKYFYDVATGSTIKNLSLESIQNFEVPVPEKLEWEGISHVLTVLDSKIELNNRINLELESMAKTLYDYWFVQFDFPDINGKPYKSSGGKMVWNEELKREIPDGWEVGKLFEVMDIQYGYPFDTNKFTEDQSYKPVIRIRDILNNSISIYSNEVVDNKYKLMKNDLVIGMDGNFHMNFWSRDNDYLNQRCVRIRSSKYPISIYQVYFEIQPHIEAREKNISRTTVGHLSDKDLKRLYVTMPNRNSEFKHQNTFDSVLSKIIGNRIENQVIAELRDWLLPMLMNGQVKV